MLKPTTNDAISRQVASGIVREFIGVSVPQVAWLTDEICLTCKRSLVRVQVRPPSFIPAAEDNSGPAAGCR